MLNRRLLYILLFTYFLVDLGFSAMQYYQFPLDGDIANIVVPSEAYQDVLNDPIGVKTVFSGENIAAPNRFFAHWSMKSYFDSIPILLQTFIDPITSIYVSSGLAKWIVHVFLLFLMSFIISGSFKFWRLDFLIAAALLAPLFQVYGYSAFMGLVDTSITYAVFYGFSMVLVLLIVSPFVRNFLHQTVTPELTLKREIALVILVLVAVFHGPLIAPVLLILSGLSILGSLVGKQKSIIASLFTRKNRLPLITIFISFYALYLGTYNTENSTDTIPILERYFRLPRGLWEIFSQKLGLALLLVFTLVNYLIISRKNIEAKKLIEFTRWSILFILIFILLLPLGGYRDYRPFIIRRDSFIPVLILMFLLYGLSTTVILKHLENRTKSIYLSALLIFSLIFINADLKLQRKNDCEKQALINLSRSDEKVIKFNNSCHIMSWQPITNPQESRTNIRLLERWGLSKTEQLYYNDVK